MNKLKLIAQKMTFRGKGILAADESTPTCSKRFEALGIKAQNQREMNTEAHYSLQKK